MRIASRGTLMGEFHRAGMMQRLLLRYIQALLTQMARTAVCNRHHSLVQQLCRWLLLSLDRLLRGVRLGRQLGESTGSGLTIAHIGKQAV